MIGLVLVSHGRLADEFLGALEHVMGPQERAATVCIGPSDDMEARRADIEAAIRASDAGEGVIVCTDMFGGTPSNLALAAMGRLGDGSVAPVEVLAGMNLPMLVKLAGVRGRKDVAECALIGQRAGRDYIKVASVMLGRRARSGTRSGADNPSGADMGSGGDAGSGDGTVGGGR